MTENNLLELAKKAQKEVESTFKNILTPEVLNQMTPEQIAKVNEAKKAFNFSGDLKEKANKLQEILNKF